MNRSTRMFVIAFVLFVGGMTIAQTREVAKPQIDEEKVKVISTGDIKEKLDGEIAKMTAVEVTLEAGKSGVAHRHPGPGFVYVLEGEYELGIDNQPTKIYKAGETFYEATGALHRVSRNPSTRGRTRLIAFVLHPRDAEEIAIPEKGTEHGHKADGK